MIQWIKDWLYERKTDRIAKRWLEDFREDVQMCYRMGYETDEIVSAMRHMILDKHDESNPEIARLLKNLRGMVESNHPVRPKHFKAVP